MKEGQIMSKEQDTNLGEEKVKIPLDVAELVLQYAKLVRPEYLKEVTRIINEDNIVLFINFVIGIIKGSDTCPWVDEVLSLNTFQEFLDFRADKTRTNFKEKWAEISALFKMPSEEITAETFESRIAKAKKIFNTQPYYTKFCSWNKLLEVTDESGFQEFKSYIILVRDLRRQVDDAYEKLCGIAGKITA
jgi:hypothetical protein